MSVIGTISKKPLTSSGNYRGMNDDELKPFQIRVSDAWMTLVDDWRRKQPTIPPRAHAIRELVIIGYEADKAGFIAKPAGKPPRRPRP
jgi:hypothetical protein